jgi:hypothetical protein
LGKLAQESFLNNMLAMGKILVLATNIPVERKTDFQWSPWLMAPSPWELHVGPMDTASGGNEAA